MLRQELEAGDWQHTRGSILGPIFFNISINEFDDGAERTLSKFADDKKLGGVADTQELVLLPGGTSLGWRNGLKGTSSSSASRIEKSCTCGGTSPCTSICWGLANWKRALQKRIWVS